MSSRGYCDDTMIIAEDLETLKKMNEWTRTFCEKHHLKINTSKTYITGRNSDGTELTEPFYWGEREIKRVPTSTPIRYLGCHLAADLNWDKQISKMNESVMHIVSCLRHRKITTLQGAVAIKEVLGPKLEIGMRHAYIPLAILDGWDTWILKALKYRSDLGSARIHRSALAVILRDASIRDKDALLKTIQKMETLTKDSEMRDHYIQEIHKANKKLRPEKEPKTRSMIDRAAHILDLKGNEELNMRARIHPKDTLTVKKLKVMVKRGLTILANSQYKQSPEKPLTRKMEDSQKCIENTITIEGYQIPFRITDNHWGKDFSVIMDNGEEVDTEDLRVTVCTDGSTFPDLEHSGAAISYTDDFTTNKEMYIPGYQWKIEENDNYAAEMAAIAKCIRSIPLSIPLTIYTDSKSCIQAIKKMTRMPKRGAPLNCSARTYLTAIVRSLELKKQYCSGKTQILHVKSHTGNRGRRFLGNTAADRKAKQAAKDENRGTEDDIEKANFELSHILYIKDTQGEENTKTWSPTHGNIRKAIKDHNTRVHIQEWSDNEKAGELIKIAEKQILSLIKETWRSPSSPKIKFLLHILNQADTQWPRPLCGRCMEGCIDTPKHIFECSANQDIFNEASKQIGRVLGVIGKEDEDTAYCDEESLPYGGTGSLIEKIIQNTMEKHTNYRSTYRTSIIQFPDGTNKEIPDKIVRNIIRLLQYRQQSYTDTKQESIRDLKKLEENTRRSTHPTFSVDQMQTEKDKIKQGDSIAIIGSTTDDKPEHIWIARVDVFSCNTVEVTWFNNTNEAIPRWILTGETTRITNTRTIISKVKWTSEPRREGEPGDSNHYGLENLEWKRLENIFKRMVKNKPWMKKQPRKRNREDSTKSESHELWEQHHKTFGLESRNRKNINMPNPTAGGQTKGYLYKKNDHYAPIHLKNIHTNLRAVVSNTTYKEGDIITPVGGKIFKITRLHKDFTSNWESHIIKDQNGQKVLFVEFKDELENFGLGHICRRTEDLDWATARLYKGKGFVRIEAIEDIDIGEEIIVYTPPNYTGTLKSEMKKHLSLSRKSETSNENTPKAINATGKLKTQHGSHNHIAQTNTHPEHRVGKPTKAPPSMSSTLREKALNYIRNGYTDEFKHIVSLKGLEPNMENQEDSFLSDWTIYSFLVLASRLAWEKGGNKTWVIEPAYTHKIKINQTNGTRWTRIFTRYRNSVFETENNTTGPDIENLDIVLLPCNISGNHWILGVLDMRLPIHLWKLTILDSKPRHTTEKVRDDLATNITQSLIPAILSKEDQSFTMKEIREGILNGWSHNITSTGATQTNDTDCGVYVCKNGLHMMLQGDTPDTLFPSQTHTDLFRLAMALDIAHNYIGYTNLENDIMSQTPKTCSIQGSHNKKKKIRRKEKIEQDRQDKDMIVIPSKPKDPFFVAKVLETNIKGEITFQWYTSIDPISIDKNGMDHASHTEDPEGIFLPCWIRDTNWTYASANRKYNDDSPYTNQHCNTKLNIDQVSMPKFNLDTDGGIPLKIYNHISVSNDFWWSKDDSFTQSEYGDTTGKRQRETQDKTHQPNKQQKLNHKNTQIQHPENKTHSTLIETLATIIRKVEDDNTSRGPTWECPPLSNIMRRHLHSTSTLNPIAMLTDERVRWKSNDKTEIQLGAINCDLKTFISGRSTWVNLIEKNEITTQQLWELDRNIRQIENNCSPTRIACLVKNIIAKLHLSQTTKRKQDQIKKYILMDIKEDSIEMFCVNQHERTFLCKTKNVDKLSILILETPASPKINHTNLQRDLNVLGLNNLNMTLRVPEGKKSRTEHDCFMTHLRDRVHMWPINTWFQNGPDPIRDKDEVLNKQVKAERSLYSHNNLLGLLGILPEHYKAHLITMGIDKDRVSRENIDVIKNIILHATMKAYDRTDKWRVRRKYDG